MYKHIFFDLDRTLWDFESNVKEIFQDIFNKYYLNKYFTNLDLFAEIYHKHNDTLWKAYRNNEIKKNTLRIQRFILTLEEFGIKNKKMAKMIDDNYITRIPSKTTLFPYTHEALQYLCTKYKLYIITNGFEETQYDKVKNCGLYKYFKKVITSDQAGYQKPRVEIFEYALKLTNARKKESIMIGDHLEIDIKGARNYGIDQVYFNPKKTPHKEHVTFEISSLKELKHLF